MTFVSTNGRIKRNQVGYSFLSSNTSLLFVFIRVHSWLKKHSWLKGKAQHFDRRRDFDVLIAHDEIQSPGSRLAWRRLRTRRRHWACASLARWTFVFFVMHIQCANDEKLSGGGCNFV